MSVEQTSANHQKMGQSSEAMFRAFSQETPTGSVLHRPEMRQPTPRLCSCIELLMLNSRVHPLSKHPDLDWSISSCGDRKILHEGLKNIVDPNWSMFGVGFPPNLAIPPACYRSLSGPSGPKRPRPRECPRKWEVFEGVSDGVSPGPSGPALRSAQKVSRECPRSGKKVDTLGTLSGHFLDTPEPGAEHPVGHSLGHPPFSGATLGDTPGTLRGRRAREAPVAGRRDRNPNPPNTIWTKL